MGLFGLTESDSKQPTSSPSWLIDAGLYVCTITKAEFGNTQQGDPKLEVWWDVAEGVFAGTNTASQYPPKETMVLAGNGLGYTKYKLECISRSNPGFDAVAAVDSGNFASLVGKYVGLGVGIEHYTKGEKSKTPGKDADRNYVHGWYDTIALRAGFIADPNGDIQPIPVPPEKDSRKNSGSAKTSQQSSTPSVTVSEDDIPF